jgi:hypothetical protein
VIIAWVINVGLGDLAVHQRVRGGGMWNWTARQSQEGWPGPAISQRRLRNETRRSNGRQV